MEKKAEKKCLVELAKPSFKHTDIISCLLHIFNYVNAEKIFCHSRMVYLPMSYLYGKRFVGPITPLILQLREELHTQPYHEINWKKVRHLCARVSFTSVPKGFLCPLCISCVCEPLEQNYLLLQEDLYNPHYLIQDLFWDSLHIFAEPLLTCWPFSKLRERALQKIMKHIHYEDENSRYINIGNTGKVMLL